MTLSHSNTTPLSPLRTATVMIALGETFGACSLLRDPENNSFQSFSTAIGKRSVLKYRCTNALIPGVPCGSYRQRFEIRLRHIRTVQDETVPYQFPLVIYFIYYILGAATLEVEVSRKDLQKSGNSPHSNTTPLFINFLLHLLTFPTPNSRRNNHLQCTPKTLLFRFLD